MLSSNTTFCIRVTSGNGDGAADGSGEAAEEAEVVAMVTVPGREVDETKGEDCRAGVVDAEGVGLIPRISAMAAEEACSMRFEARCRARDLKE